MIKSLLGLLLYFLCLPQFFCQKNTIPSVDFRTGVEHDTYNGLGRLFEFNEQLIVIRPQRKDNVFQAFDQNFLFQRFDVTSLNETFRNEIELPKNSAIRAVVQSSGRLYVLYSTTILSKSERGEEFYIGEIDIKSGVWASPAKQFHKSSTLLSGDPYINSAVVAASVKVKSSSDKSRFMLSYYAGNVTKDGKSHSLNGLVVFTDQMQVLWKEETTLPFNIEEGKITGQEVDNLGRAHIITSLFKDENGLGSVYVKHDETKTTTVEFELPFKYLYEMSMVSHKNGEISYIGYGTSHPNTASIKNSRFSSAQFVFCVNMNNTNQVSGIFSYPIPMEIQDRYESAKTRKDNIKKAEKGTDGIFQLQIQKVEIMNDGLFVIGEEETTFAPIASRDIFMARLNSVGELMWMQKLPKEQIGLETTAFGFHHTIKNGNHYFLYSDDRSNLNLAEEESPTNYSVTSGKGSLIITSISDKSGALGRKPLFDLEGGLGLDLKRIYPSLFYNGFADEIYFVSPTGPKKNVLGAFTIPD